LLRVSTRAHMLCTCALLVHVHVHTCKAHATLQNAPNTPHADGRSRATPRALAPARGGWVALALQSLLDSMYMYGCVSECMYVCVDVCGDVHASEIRACPCVPAAWAAGRHRPPCRPRLPSRPRRTPIVGWLASGLRRSRFERSPACVRACPSTRQWGAERAWTTATVDARVDTRRSNPRGRSKLARRRVPSTGSAR
jgi:hypothetical protein